jgi:hypothetical protein
MLIILLMVWEHEVARGGGCEYALSSKVSLGGRVPVPVPDSVQTSFHPRIKIRTNYSFFPFRQKKQHHYNRKLAHYGKENISWISGYGRRLLKLIS